MSCIQSNQDDSNYEIGWPLLQNVIIIGLTCTLETNHKLCIILYELTGIDKMRQNVKIDAGL